MTPSCHNLNHDRNVDDNEDGNEYAFVIVKDKYNMALNVCL